MIKLTQEQFIEKLMKKYPNQLDIDSIQYINHSTKIQLICLKHGIFYSTPNRLLSKNVKFACPFCNNSILNKFSFLEKANKKHNNKYQYHHIPDDIDSHSYIDIFCSNHNGYFKQRVCNHLRGSGCNICCYTTNKSKGEIRIAEYLKLNNIKFVKEFTIKNETRKRSYVRFDFYLPDYNLMIEFDGKQHYIYSEHFGSIDVFHRLRANDFYKNQYCKEHNIRLIRIPQYLFHKIDEIINYEMTKIKNPSFKEKLHLGKIKFID